MDEKGIVSEKSLNSTELVSGQAEASKQIETAQASTLEAEKPGQLATEAGANGGTPPTRKLARSRPVSRPTRRKRRKIWLWALGLLVLVGAGVGAYLWLNVNQTPTGFQGQTTPASSRSPVSLTVNASGQVQANADLKLSFGSGGTVTEVLVKAGDPVKKGQSIARLDDRDLQTALKTAQASLKSAQADLDKVKAGATEKELQTAAEELKQAQLQAEEKRNGNALPAEIQSARSKVESARANLEKVKQGGTQTEKAKAQSSVSSAESDLKAAQAKLDVLLAGPTSADITAAQAKVDQAQAALEATKSNLNNQITSAQVARDQALTALNRAQDKYSYIYRQNHKADGTLKDGLNDADVQQETAAYRDLQDAQGNYNKAESTLSDAKVNYTTGIRKAQSSLDDANAQLDKTKAGPTSSEVVEAQANVEKAQANLNSAKDNLAKLTPTKSDLASAQADYDNAVSNLAKLTTGGTPDEVAQAESNVRIKEVALQELQKGPTPSDIATKQAQLDIKQAEYDKAALALENSSLKAPFDGVIAALEVVPGQVVGTSTEVAQLIDDSEMHVDMSVSESDVGKLKLNQAVSMKFEAIPNQTFTGKITFISPKAQVSNNVVSYPVKVTLDAPGTNSLQEAFPEQFKKYEQSVSQPLTQSKPNSPTGTPNSEKPGSEAGGPQVFTFSSGSAAPGGVSLLGGSNFCGYTLLPFGLSQKQTQPKTGMTASVTICLDARAGTLSVPTRAVKTKIENSKPVQYVEVLDEQEKIIQKTVTTGLQGDSSIEITGGELKEGDKIVLSTGLATPNGQSDNGPSNQSIPFVGPPKGGEGGNFQVVIK